jgi:hypothetical protein
VDRNAVTWFQRQRSEWIIETVKIFGFINREHIERKFEITSAVASTDLRDVMAAHPDLIRYNKNAKRYEAIQPESYIGSKI